MSKSGSGKKPDLGVVTGTAGRKGAPSPDAKIPKPPAHLNGVALAEWKRIAPELLTLSLISEVDCTALAAYCECYGCWVAACIECDEKGTYIEVGTNGYKQVAPWFTVKMKMADQMKRFITEFGMSPNSRNNLKVKRPGRADGRGKLSQMRNRSLNRDA